MSNVTALTTTAVHHRTPLAEMERMAAAVAKSGLFGVKTPDQALALMLIADAEGMHPALAARDYDIIQGRPSKKAEAMLRDFQRAGGRVEWHTLTDDAAAATFTHESGGTVRIDWDLKRAGTAGLAAKDMWKKYPRQMLRARVVSEGVRTVWPSATSGMYTPEEQHDITPRGPDAARDVTPSRPTREDVAAVAEDIKKTAREIYAAVRAAETPEAADAIITARHVEMFKIKAADPSIYEKIMALIPEQEADTPATAESDSGSPSLAGVVPAPTVALPEHLEARAQTIRNAIAAARTVKDLDRIMLAQRGTLDDITGVDAAAGEALMQAMRDRVAAVGAA